MCCEMDPSWCETGSQHLRAPTAHPGSGAGAKQRHNLESYLQDDSDLQLRVRTPLSRWGKRGSERGALGQASQGRSQDPNPAGPGPTGSHIWSIPLQRTAPHCGWTPQDLQDGRGRVYDEGAAAGGTGLRLPGLCPHSPTCGLWAWGSAFSPVKWSPSDSATVGSRASSSPCPISDPEVLPRLRVESAMEATPRWDHRLRGPARPLPRVADSTSGLIWVFKHN